MRHALAAQVTVNARTRLHLAGVNAHLFELRNTTLPALSRLPSSTTALRPLSLHPCLRWCGGMAEPDGTRGFMADGGKHSVGVDVIMLYRRGRARSDDALRDARALNDSSPSWSYERDAVAPLRHTVYFYRSSVLYTTLFLLKTTRA